MVLTRYYQVQLYGYHAHKTSRLAKFLRPLGIGRPLFCCTGQ